MVSHEEKVRTWEENTIQIDYSNVAVKIQTKDYK